MCVCVCVCACMCVRGILGDCWLLSAMSVAATHPELLDKVMVTKEPNPEGVYAVQFFKCVPHHLLCCFVCCCC